MSRYCETQQDVARKYFSTIGGEESAITGTYARANIGLITLLSDVQMQVEFHVPESDRAGKSYWISVLNDVKAVLAKQGEPEHDAYIEMRKAEMKGS